MTLSEKQDLQEDLIRSLGLEEFPIRQPPPERKRYYRWNETFLKALAAIAGLEATP